MLVSAAGERMHYHDKGDPRWHLSNTLAKADATSKRQLQ